MEKTARFADWDYWARPVPGFGDPAAHLLIVGLAPAAHGANRTGRVFTGDRSGDFLYAALHRCGYANQPTSVSADDGLVLTGAYITAPVKCAPPANKPAPDERDRCRPWFDRELALLPTRAGRARARTLRMGRGVLELRRRTATTTLCSRSGVTPTGWSDPARQLPREPAEHLHRGAHSGHAARSPRTRDRNRRKLRAVRKDTYG